MEPKTKKPKTEPLIGASLEMLHRESRSWQDTVAFWKDETQFFANLLANKRAENSEYGRVLQNMDKVHETLFEYLAEDIVEHGENLAELMKGEKRFSDNEFREHHRKLRHRMEVFTKDFNDFKRMVFGYARKI